MLGKEAEKRGYDRKGRKIKEQRESVLDNVREGFSVEGRERKSR